ncbi:unnamed protein product [Caenorhabditis nigoni]|nr:hypothetical protein B9Z55_017431 [Caenorhabditis nigoni]
MKPDEVDKNVKKMRNRPWDTASMKAQIPYDPESFQIPQIVVTTGGEFTPRFSEIGASPVPSFLLSPGDKHM